MVFSLHFFVDKFHQFMPLVRFILQKHCPGMLCIISSKEEIYEKILDFIYTSQKNFSLPFSALYLLLASQLLNNCIELNNTDRAEGKESPVGRYIGGCEVINHKNSVIV